jgi:hypothetical protein
VIVALLGTDCSTDPRKTGLALGELHGSTARWLVRPAMWVGLQAMAVPPLTVSEPPTYNEAAMAAHSSPRETG